MHMLAALLGTRLLVVSIEAAFVAKHNSSRCFAHQ